MKFTGMRTKKLTLVTIAGYFFIFALAAKVVFLYVNHLPPREELLSVEGIVRQVRLGGDGRSTWLRIESGNGTHRYSSYYGKVWPGMELIDPGDRVNILAERNKLSPNELLLGKQYYIWEMIHRNRMIVGYEDVRELVENKEATVNRYVNGFLAASAASLLVAYIRRIFLAKKKPSANN